MRKANGPIGQWANRTLSLALLAFTCAATISAQDWPQILGPNRNGIYTGPPIVPSFPRTGPPLIWKREVGAGFAGPAVAGDRLILFHRLNNRETVEAMNALTGKTIWTFDYPTAYRDDFGFDEGPRAIPVIAGGRVFTHGADGMLHGIDFSTGKMLWSSDTRKLFDAPKGYFGVASSPVVDGNQVIVGADEKAPAGDRRRRQHTAINGIARQHLSRSAGLQHERFAALAGKVDLPVGGDGRRREDAAEPFAPDALAGAGIHAGDDAHVASHVKKAIVVNER